MKFAPAVLSLAIILGGCSQTQLGDGSVTTGSTIPPSAETKTAQLPRCTQPLATLAIEEKPIEALAALGLTPPTPVIKAYVSDSNCFQIVDPNAAGIAARYGAKQKPIVPDYLLTADILSQNPNAGGGTANVGSFLPGAAGQILQSVSFNTSEVKTTLTLADTRTGLQVALINGHAQTTDVGFSFGGATRRGAVSFGAYADTPIGRTTSAALLDAYVKLVRHVESKPKPVALAKKR